jgi:hypothetical protein
VAAACEKYAGGVARMRKKRGCLTGFAPVAKKKAIIGRQCRASNIGPNPHGTSKNTRN